MQIHTEFRGIPGNFIAKNTAEFRGISWNSVFQKIPYSIGSQKRTSVDTLVYTLPPLVQGEDTLAGWREGGGSILNSSADARYCSVLYICRYFVSTPLGCLAQQAARRQSCGNFVRQHLNSTITSCGDSTELSSSPLQRLWWKQSWDIDGKYKQDYADVDHNHRNGFFRFLLTTSVCAKRCWMYRQSPAGF